MTDATVIQHFLSREKRWGATLHALRTFHHQQMGKATSEIQWIGGAGPFGRLSWLGYYWHEEMFWFGYGLHEGAWRPLIEADNRSKYTGTLEQLRQQLSAEWESVTAEGNLFRRLWAPADTAGDSEKELDWFKSRSRELHEYVVQPAQ